jgi:long-chain acyl-CoA synthetase
VAGSAVMGIDDARLGEKVVAAVELRPGQVVTAAELIEHVRAQLARYKVPDQLLIVERLPRNAMSKVIKRDLRRLFEAPTG